MKEKLAELVYSSASKLISPSLIKKIDISIPQERYGDFSTNAPILLAPLAGKEIFEVASFIANELKNNPIFEKVEAMRNGFVNFTLSMNYLQQLISEITKLDYDYGKSSWGNNQKVLIEFVSANPTGPLHVGHGRWAVIGDDIASLLKAVGYKVQKEFYVNDIGNQIDKLEASVKARIAGTDIPEGGYGGLYINDVAETLKDTKENFRPKLLKIMLDQQKAVLNKLGIEFDSFFSEETLHKSGKVKDAVFKLEMQGKTIKEEGALWFKSQEYGDDKNRVLVRENGETTYFAADIAYHAQKFEKGFDNLIDIWGADHHGYVARLKAAIKAIGLDSDKLEIIIGQLVSLFRGSEPVRMSKRTGEMVTLEEVVDEVGRDATRFFMTMTSVHSHLDFDMELAKQNVSNNPVFYVQYAHARICNILAKSEIRIPNSEQGNYLKLLTHPAERNLMRKLLDLPDVITIAARKREPHTLIEYIKTVAAIFHNFYHQCRVISDDKELTSARLALVSATRIVFRNVLELLKVSAPERM